MFGVVISQYIFAVSHVFRAQPSELYVHMRRAIEAAGIAYIVESEPELAKLYGRGDEKKLWQRIKRNKILPVGNTVTRELNSMMKPASSKLHGNLQSVARSIEETFEVHGSHVEIDLTFRINEPSPDGASWWPDCFYILTAMYNICRVFEESFRLPRGAWHDRLEAYRSTIFEFDSIVSRQIAEEPLS